MYPRVVLLDAVLLRSAFEESNFDRGVVFHTDDISTRNHSTDGMGLAVSACIGHPCMLWTLAGMC